MTDFTLDDIRKLRDLTGVGLTEAKQALMDSDSFEVALQKMQAKGLGRVAARSDRSAQAGAIISYVHDRRIGVLVELNCETDFVAKNDDFLAVAKDLALQIAASNPTYVSVDDWPAVEQAHHRQALVAELDRSDLPVEHRASAVAGRLQKIGESCCLLSQTFNREPSLTVGEFVNQQAARLGEKLVVARFVRFELGQTTTEDA